MDNALVKIWGQPVGGVTWDPAQKLAYFRYTPEFQRSGTELAPLQMPVRQNQVFFFPELGNIPSFEGLPGLLADALPDRYGNRLIEQWLARNGRPANSMNPVEKLCFIGQRGMGALEFEPAQFATGTAASRLEVDSLVQTAQAMLQDRQAFSAQLTAGEQQAMEQVLRVGTSAGGARPKAIVAFHPQRGIFTSGQVAAQAGFEYYLLKLDGVTPTTDHLGDGLGYGRIEMAYSEMAKAAGIDMMPCQLLEENGRAHFMTQRFDRETDGEKHHIQTFAAMRHLDFDNVGQYSYEELFQCMRELHLSYPEAEQMFVRMVFNVLAMNRDDHAKNFAFRLKKGGDWHLAPAYDITFAFDPQNRWLNVHAMTINGKVDHITREDLLTVARQMSIKQPQQHIARVLEALKQWPTFAEKHGVPQSRIQHIQSTFPQI